MKTSTPLLTSSISRRVHGCHQAAVAHRSRPVRGLPVEARHQAAHEIQEGVPDVQRRYPGGTSHKHTKIQEKPKNNDLRTLQIMISKHYK